MSTAENPDRSSGGARARGRRAAEPEGGRASARRAAERAIESAALRLALELGAANVTVEAIAERAGIPAAAVRDAYPTAAAAIVGRSIRVPEGADALAVLDSSPDDLPLGVFRLMFAAIGHNRVSGEVARLRARLLAEQPETVRLTLAALFESSQHLVGCAAEWLRRHPDRARLASPDREAVLAVTLVHGAIAAQASEWMLSTGDVTAEEPDFLRLLEEYRRLLG